MILLKYGHAAYPRMAASPGLWNLWIGGGLATAPSGLSPSMSTRHAPRIHYHTLLLWPQHHPPITSALRVGGDTPPRCVTRADSKARDGLARIPYTARCLAPCVSTCVSLLRWIAAAVVHRVVWIGGAPRARRRRWVVGLPAAGAERGR